MIGVSLNTVAPDESDVIEDDGAIVSVDAVVCTKPVCRLPACTPMSANRLTVACCMRPSVGVPPPSCVASRPHDHWIVPAPNTSAPLA